MKPNNTNKHASSGTPIHHMSIEPLPSADAIAATTIDPVNENIRQLTSAANTIVSIDIEETDPIVDKVKHIKKSAYKPHYTFLLSLLAVLLIILCATVALSGIYQTF